MKTFLMNGTKPILMSLVIAVAVLLPHRVLAAAPVVDNANGATNVLSISAILNGTLTSTGGVPTQVYVYWGQTDGGTTFGNWSNTNDFGTNDVGPLSLMVTNLLLNQTGFYRFYATNQDGQAWASATTNFQTQLASGPSPVILGTTAHFAILAGAAITTTGGGMINGDVGASPIDGADIGIPPVQVNGTIYAVDATGTQASNVKVDPTLLTAAKGDLTIAMNDAAGRTPVPTGTFLNPNGGNIGGLTLVPGLYKFTGTALITGADVTLVGGPNDVWIFMIAADLETGTGIKVILAGGARAKNVFWQVHTSATIGTYGVFKGTILADQAVVMQDYSTMEGRAMSFTAGVTYNGQGNGLPSVPPAPVFTHISRISTNSDSITLNTTPYNLLTLETCPDLSLTNWTGVVTNTPNVGSWTYTNAMVMTTATQRFYRAFLSPYSN